MGDRNIAGRDGVRATVDAFFEYIDRDTSLYHFVVENDMRHGGSGRRLAFTEQNAQHVAAAIREGLAAAGRDPRQPTCGVAASSAWCTAPASGGWPSARGCRAPGGRRPARRPGVGRHRRPAAGAGHAGRSVTAVRVRHVDAGAPALAGARAVRDRLARAAVAGAIYDSGNGWPVAAFGVDGDGDVDRHVPGVLVELDPARLAEALVLLDDVEDTATDLLRRVEVTTADGATAWAYHFPHAHDGLQRIDRWDTQPDR